MRHVRTKYTMAGRYQASIATAGERQNKHHLKQSQKHYWGQRRGSNLKTDAAADRASSHARERGSAGWRAADVKVGAAVRGGARWPRGEVRGTRRRGGEEQQQWATGRGAMHKRSRAGLTDRHGKAGRAGPGGSQANRNAQGRESRPGLSHVSQACWYWRGVWMPHPFEVR